MKPLQTLRQKVETLYTGDDPNADPWIDWGYKNHVLWVADKTEKIAQKQGANVDLAVAGALLHDIADAVTSRKDPDHEAKSLELADRLLHESGFSLEDITFIVMEIIKPHSCKELMPTALEGKVMATADGAAHFMTDFYLVFLWRHFGPQPPDYQTFKDWVLKKMEKDITKKFFFDDVKAEVMPRYDVLKQLFSYSA
jgi:putative nucleotidyltransferase with HDIG domain